MKNQQNMEKSIETAFFEQKIRTLFHRFDMDHNGKIEIEDFNQWSAKLAKIGGLDAERSAVLAQNLLAIWNTYFLPADTNNDGSVEVQELTTHMRQVIINNNLNLSYGL
jgi:Ca2+-binding EF-hand superfamily protein